MQEPHETLSLLRWIGVAQRKAADDWSRERGLTMEQAFALGWLLENPGAIQRDLAQITRTSPASVSSLLQGLERGGLVERRSEAGDERRKRIYPTTKATGLTAGFAQAMKDVDAEILAPLDEQERATLHSLLAKITARLPAPTRG